MGIDRKYGNVTLEHGTIGADEPVVVFRAQDAMLPGLLDLYRQLCTEAGSPDHHLTGIDATKADIVAWQQDHHIQVPRSA